MFESIRDYTIQTLTERFNARPLIVPPQFQMREGVLRGEGLRMTNVAFETDLLRKVRVTYMDGGSAAQILTVMAFPRTVTDLPIFGADMLSFKGAPHLNVIDHQPLFKSDPAYVKRYIDPMADLFARWEHLPARGRSLPPWTEDFFSPYSHYSRPDPEDADQILDCYREYWDAYLDRVSAVSSLAPDDAPRIHARQAEYCRNHTENEQAESMLQKLFGNEWCEAFIRDFLFDVHPELPGIHQPQPSAALHNA